MGVSVIGPINLRDKNIGTEKTAAQIHTVSDIDSRIHQRVPYLQPYQIRELRKDPTIQLARWAVLSPMIHTPWTYVNLRAGGKASASKEMIDLVNETLTPLRNSFLMQATFGSLDFGWQPFEIIYKSENSYIYVDNLKPLLQDFTTILIYINNGKFAGFVNEPPGFENSSIVYEDYAHLSNFEAEAGDWYGYSIYQSTYKIQNSWDSIQETANRYDKKIAGASWVVYYPVGETKFKGTVLANDVIALSILNDLIASGGVVIPDEIQDSISEIMDKDKKGRWRIEIIEASGSNQTSFIDRQKYLDALKMRAFGHPERSLTEGNHGTKEEASVHGDVGLSIVDSRHRLLCDQLNLYVVPKILTKNFGKKWAYSVGVQPAPLIDTQLAIVKDIYRVLLQTPEIAMRELGSIDLKSIKGLLNLPMNGEETNTDFEAVISNKKDSEKIAA